MSVWTFIHEASWFSQAVLLLLALLSLSSWAIILERLVFFRARAKAGAAFARVQERATDFAGLLELSGSHPRAAEAMNMQETQKLLQAFADPDPDDWEMRLWSAQQKREAEQGRYLSLLATVSSASPFIGLLGTVWGVMVAFLRIGTEQGQAMLEIVGPGIAEALIATVVGLATAIPATIAYNLYLSRARRLRESQRGFLELALMLLKHRPGEL